MFTSNLSVLIPNICHYRHYRRQCTFFKPVPLFPQRKQILTQIISHDKDAKYAKQKPNTRSYLQSGTQGAPEFWCPAELQNYANRANQLVLLFLAGANFWEKHAKNVLSTSARRYQPRCIKYSILKAFMLFCRKCRKSCGFGANLFGGKIGRS